MQIPRIFNKIILSFLTLFFSVIFSFNTLAAPVAFKIDPDHSHVLWHIQHLGFSTQTGKWFANGTLMLDKEKPQNSSVDVTVNVADLVTGIPDLDKHLKSEDFFDVAKYPTATFVSNKVIPQGKDKAKVYGTLTLHGVSKPVVLDVTLNKTGESPVTKKMTAGFSATTQIKRSDFGIKTFLPALGDDVKLNIEVEASPK